MSRNGILAAGTWLVDHIKLLDEFPEQDRLCYILDQQNANGGCAYNVIKDLANMKCGFPLEAAGLIGNDSDGNFILNDCKNLGIDVSRLKVSQTIPTSYTDVMTDSKTGRRTFFHCSGTNAELTDSDIDVTSSNAKIFLEGYFGLHAKMDAVDANGENGHSRIFKKAKSLGFITVADLVSSNADFVKITAAALPHLDILSLNEIELQMITGENDNSKSKDFDNIERLAKKVLEKGINKFLVVHFPECALAFEQGGKRYVVPSIDMPKEYIKGKVGAGDAFLAGILLGVHNNWSIEECLNMAACAATQSITDISSSNGLIDYKECLKLADKFGYCKI